MPFYDGKQISHGDVGHPAIQDLRNGTTILKPQMFQDHKAEIAIVAMAVLTRRP